MSPRKRRYRPLPLTDEPGGIEELEDALTPGGSDREEWTPPVVAGAMNIDGTPRTPSGSGGTMRRRPGIDVEDDEPDELDGWVGPCDEDY